MQGVKSIYGSSRRGVAEGLNLRMDNGCQYTSGYFLDALAYYGIRERFGIVRQPKTTGGAERFNWTLKEQIFYDRIFQGIEEVREAVKRFIELYNEEWLIAKRGYQSPCEARRKYKQQWRVT